MMGLAKSLTVILLMACPSIAKACEDLVALSCYVDDVVVMEMERLGYIHEATGTTSFLGAAEEGIPTFYVRYEVFLGAEEAEGVVDFPERSRAVIDELKKGFSSSAATEACISLPDNDEWPVSSRAFVEAGGRIEYRLTVVVSTTDRRAVSKAELAHQVVSSC